VRIRARGLLRSSYDYEKSIFLFYNVNRMLHGLLWALAEGLFLVNAADSHGCCTSSKRREVREEIDAFMPDISHLVCKAF
jgi:hypothetical protein